MKPTPDELGIEVTDKHGAHACACMRRIGEIGVDAFLEEEMANPSSDDPDWPTFVVQWKIQREDNVARGWPATRARA